MFAPLHDIGTIVIPDNILLKPDRLDAHEWQMMLTHARKGREMIDEVIYNFNLVNVENIDVLRKIAEFHDEAV